VSADTATSAMMTASAAAATGGLATTISSIQSSVASLQSAPAPLVTVAREGAIPGDSWYADCTAPTSSTIFPVGACPRMASAKCKALGYKDGWFEGDLDLSNPYISCIK
jgi:hypothetical protein